jgi:hypothetical protein
LLISKVNIFDTVTAILTLLSIIGLGLYFYELAYPDLTQEDPFRMFNSNGGIIKISIASIISRLVFFVFFLILSTRAYQDNILAKFVYVTSALVIGFLQWYELYYGSTFYYGEVRDKQGLMFPALSSLMVTLVIWKINYSKFTNRNLTIKIVMTGLINLGLYMFWKLVSESWNLWQS